MWRRPISSHAFPLLVAFVFALQLLSSCGDPEQPSQEPDVTVVLNTDPDERGEDSRLSPDLTAEDGVPGDIDISVLLDAGDSATTGDLTIDDTPLETSDLPVVTCGDGVCELPEDPSSCASDCLSNCGDGLCTHEENASTCPQDCTGCGDGVCASTESPCICALDCPSVCGDSCCSAGENQCLCAIDCAIACGDGCCSFGENPGNCPQDCPTACGDGYCAGPETTCNCESDCGFHCGNGACDCNETAYSCAKDCVHCGDSVCDWTESQCNCPGDCPVACGDSCCSSGENPGNCLQDCPTSCGDGFCLSTETPANCLSDCPTTCGDGYCAGAESICNCQSDCGAHCGNGACDCSETKSTCPGDCIICGDGVCESPETPGSCVADCPTTCGDGYCAGAESSCTCQEDCGPHCGNGWCDCGETLSTCEQDCLVVVPSNGCANGSQNRAGCAAARIIGRADARDGWSVVNQDTCGASDKFTGSCNGSTSSGGDHAYAIFAFHGESLHVDLDARTTYCSFDQTQLAPRLRLFYNAGTLASDAASCPTSVNCWSATWAGDSIVQTISISQDGWYFLVVDGGSWGFDEDAGYYDLDVSLSGCATAGCGCL